MIFIKKFVSFEEQVCNLGNHEWSVARLNKLAENLPLLEIPLEHLNVYYKYESLTLRDMVSHINAVMDAELNYPILLDEDGELMDGRHRIMKAILKGEGTIKAKRFDVNPEPCKIKGD